MASRGLRIPSETLLTLRTRLAGLPARSTVNRWLKDWDFAHPPMTRAALATWFEARHSNAFRLRPEEAAFWKLTVQRTR